MAMYSKLDRLATLHKLAELPRQLAEMVGIFQTVRSNQLNYERILEIVGWMEDAVDVLAIQIAIEPGAVFSLVISGSAIFAHWEPIPRVDRCWTAALNIVDPIVPSLGVKGVETYLQRAKVRYKVLVKAEE